MIKDVLVTALVTGMLGIAQDGVPVRMTVAVEATHGKDVPELQREDVLAFQGKQRLPVTEWTALKGERAGRELFMLIDDASAMNLGSQLSELREFINSQPASTLIGIGYMRNGMTDILQNLTSDHTKAAKTLRLPLGAIAGGASPYLALNDLVKRWPGCCVPKEVVLISSGIDPLGGLSLADPYLDSAIEQAQRAGLIVYAVYTPITGHGGHSYWRMNWGQSHLAQLAEETGGESYMLGFETPVSFAPYLRDIEDHLAHQYSVSFLARPLAKPGLIDVRLATEIPGAEIVAAPRVYVTPEPPPSTSH